MSDTRSMKKVLLYLKQQELLTILELILRHWGYRVFATHRRDAFRNHAEDWKPDLVMVGNDLLQSSDIANCARKAAGRSGHNLVCIEEDPARGTAVETVGLKVPVDVFELYRVMQKYLEEKPRTNFRIAMRVPGMVVRPETTSLVEVLSISARGLFLKTSLKISRGERFRLVLPLLGMKRELELGAEVLYVVEPSPENGYQQGVGLEFTDLGDQERCELEAFLERALLEELDDKHGRIEIDLSRLNLHTPQPSPVSLPGLLQA